MEKLNKLYEAEVINVEGDLSTIMWNKNSHS